MKYGELTHSIIGCAMEVHRELGNGFQELIYQRSLALELDEKKIKYAREVEMDVFYKGVVVGSRRVDFMIENILAVEIKAIKVLEDVHLAQAMNYLEAYNLEVGLLINFGARSLDLKEFTTINHSNLIILLIKVQTKMF